MQQPMTLDANFTPMYLPYFSPHTLGFDHLASEGTGEVGAIAGVGGAQGACPGPSYYDMPGAFTINAPHANGLPPVLIATGTLNLANLTEVGSGYYVETAGNATVWRWDGGAAGTTKVDDSLPIYVIPEPGSLAMIAIAGLLLLRRGRW
jgi:hypothetical protein